MTLIKSRNSTIVHESRGPRTLCGITIARKNLVHRLEGKPTCSRCLSVKSSDLRLALDATHTHWQPYMGRPEAPCGARSGMFLTATSKTTCPDCKKHPDFREARIGQVYRRLVHQIASHPREGRPEVSCGATDIMYAHRDISKVDCLACLRAEDVPEAESPPSRRILLDENG